MKRGETYVDQKDRTWRLKRVYRRDVLAEFMDDECPTGLLWKFSRAEVSKWTAATKS